MDIQLEKKGGIKKKHIPYIVIGVIFCAVILMIIFNGNRRSMRVVRETLSFSIVEEGEFKEYVRINAQVQPRTTVQISPLEGGIVMEFVAEEGADVKRGDVIVRLENSQLNLDILNTEASLAEKENFLRDTRVKMEQEKLNLQQEIVQLRTNEQKTKRRWDQYTRLVKDKLVSTEDYEQAKEEYELARDRRILVANRQVQDSIYRTIQVDNMEISLANMRKNMALTYERLANLRVKSPIDGQLGSLDVVLGQNLSAGTKIGQVNDLSSYKIQAKIDELYIDRIFVGLAGSLERGGEQFELAVTKVYPEVTEAKFKVDLVFKAALPDNIRSGQTYFINLETGEPSNSIYIARGSFYQNTAGKWIYLLTKDGDKVVRREIKIGRQNPQYYEILDGLERGDKVVISSYDMFGDSQELTF